MASTFRLMTKRVPQHNVPVLTSSIPIPCQVIPQRTASTLIAQHGKIPTLRTTNVRDWHSNTKPVLSQCHATTSKAERFRLELESKSISHRISRCQQWRLLHCSSRKHASPKPSQDDHAASTPPPDQQQPKQSLMHDLNSADHKSTSKTLPNLLSSSTTTHENIYTLPNFLTTTRILTAPIISYALLHSQPFLAMALFTYSSITDLIDGYLARRYNSGTVLGSILDPFADKLLMTLTTITLYSIGTFPWWLALIILGRDGGLLLSALYFRWISLPPPRTMVRYWDFSLPSAEVRPTEISKINTLLQFLLVANALLLPTLPTAWVEVWNLWGIFEGWMVLVAGTTVWSGASYLFTRDAIRFIGRERR